MADITVPGSSLDTFPLYPPPQGQVSNFKNSKTNGDSMIVVTSVFLGFQIVFFGLRMYTRAFVAHKLRWDDLTCAIGFVFSVAFYTLCIIGVQHSFFGYHMWNISISQIMKSNLFLLGYLTQIAYPIGMAFIKLTFFIFYWEVFQPLRWARIAIWFGAITSTIFYLLCLIIHAVFSAPKKGQTWFTHSITEEEHKDLLLGVPSAAISAVIDFYILIIPLCGIWNVRLSFKRKMALTCIFMTGIMACICSVVILYYRIVLLHTRETLWTLPAVLATSVLESQIGTVCCCMPALPPLALKFKKQQKQVVKVVTNSFLRRERQPKVKRRSDYMEFDDDTTRKDEQIELSTRTATLGGHSSVQTHVGTGVQSVNEDDEDAIHVSQDMRQNIVYGEEASKK